MTSDHVADCVTYVQRELAAAANPEKAQGMQAYMKTAMPFYGVQKPGRTPILRHVLAEFRPATRDEYEELVLALWGLPHREEKYLSLGLAVGARECVVPESMGLYKRLIVEGAWWDLVDKVATHLVRPLVIEYPDQTWPEVDSWIDDEVMWLRRAAIICQVGAKDRTDARRLFSFCRQRAHEAEFFVRKAIGWALHEYAKTDPESVARFVTQHRSELSGLSFREATKHIGHHVSS